MYVLIIIHEI